LFTAFFWACEIKHSTIRSVGTLLDLGSGEGDCRNEHHQEQYQDAHERIRHVFSVNMTCLSCFRGLHTRIFKGAKGLLESQATGSDFSCGVDEDPEEILD
jgi:hypothetical protein